MCYTQTAAPGSQPDIYSSEPAVDVQPRHPLYDANTVPMQPSQPKEKQLFGAPPFDMTTNFGVDFAWRPTWPDQAQARRS